MDGNRFELVDDLESAIKIAHQQMANETWNVDGDRATGNARGLAALDAAFRFLQRVLEAVAKINLLEIGGALLGVALRHADLGGAQFRQFLVAPLFLLEERLLQVADVGVIRVGFLLRRLEAFLTRHQLLEIHSVAVEVRPVDAREPDLAVDGDPARSAHAGTVHHDGVQRHHGLGAERPRRLDAGIHHRQRTDGDHQIRRVGLKNALQGLGNETRPAVAAVVGTDHQIVAERLEAIFPEYQRLASEADDAGGAVAGLVEGAKLRVDRRDPEPAAHQHDMADPLHMLRQSERPDEVGETVAGLVAIPHLPCGLAQRLDDEGDGSLVAVEVGDGERDPLASLVQADHHEVSRLGRLRHVRREHLPQEGGVGKRVAADDRVHGQYLLVRLVVQLSLKGRSVARRPSPPQAAPWSDRGHRPAAWPGGIP